MVPRIKPCAPVQHQTMLNNIGHFSPTALPCALRSLRYGHGTQALAPMSGDEGQLQFLQWVESTRTASSESFPEIYGKEKLTCPLIWCRTSFKDLSSTLEHVSACPLLSDACYWCPYCGRPERFKKRDPTSSGMIHQNKRGAKPSYRRAVAFFQSPGHRDNSHANPFSSSIPRASIEQSGDMTHCPDLGRRLHQNPKGSSSLYELDDGAQYATPVSDGSRLFLNSDHATATPQLPKPAHSARLQSLPLGCVISQRSVAAVDSHADKYYKSNDAIVPGNETLVPPIQVSSTLSGAGACLPSLQTSQSDAPTLHAIQSSIRNGKGIDTPSPTTFDGSESSYCEERISSHAYIANLRDGIRAMSEEWIRRLASSAKISRLDSRFYARALFELGIAALGNNFRGVGPSGFLDVFAMTHVVIMSSSIVCEDHDEQSWNLILEGVYQWNTFIADTTEREIFLGIMRRRCHPSQFTDPPAFHDSTMEDGFLHAEEPLASLIRDLSSTHRDSSIHEEIDKSCQVFTIDDRQTTQPRIPQANVAMKAFTDFLDDFAHAVIVEDLANRRTFASQYIRQHSSGIATLDRNIVGRLYEWEGLEAFHGIVNEIQDMLRCGLLQTVRDVEVMLSWSGKTHSRSPRLLQEYLNVIKYLCDEVMKESGLHWRDPFYEAILGTVIATASELHHSKGHTFHTPPATPSDQLNGNQNTLPPPASAATSSIEPHPAPSPPPDPIHPSPAPSEPISHCPDPTCNASFRGASQKSNLNRHLRSALHHKQDSLFKCEFCNSAFGRSDNLQQHVRKIHGVDPIWVDF